MDACKRRENYVRRVRGTFIEYMVQQRDYEISATGRYAKAFEA